MHFPEACAFIWKFSFPLASFHREAPGLLLSFYLKSCQLKIVKMKLLFYSLAVILFLLDHGKTFIYYKLLSSDPNFCDVGRQTMVEVTTAPTCSHIIRVTVNKGN